MRPVNHETNNPVVNLSLQGGRFHKRGPGIVRCVSFLTGMIFAVALGLAFTLSTPALAGGGGGGGYAPAPKPQITEVEDPVAKPRDGDPIPAISESKDKRPEEDKTSKKPDDKTDETAEVDKKAGEETSEVVTNPDDEAAEAVAPTMEFGHSVDITHYTRRSPGKISIINEKHIPRIKASNFDRNPNLTVSISIENLGIIDGDVDAASYFSGDILIKNAIQGIIHRDIDVSNSGTGKISIENWGIINRDMNLSHSGNGGIKITNHGTINHDMDVSNFGTGETSIENLGTINRNMDLSHYGDDGIRIANHGTVNRDMFISNFGNAKTLIENRGIVNRDMYLSHYKAGEIKIVNHGTVGREMHVSHYGDGGIKIANHATVGDWDIKARHHGDGEISIKNLGKVSGEIDVTHYGEGDILITSHRAGGIDVEHYGSGVIYFDGSVNGPYQRRLQGETIRLGNVVFERGLSKKLVIRWEDLVFEEGNLIIREERNKLIIVGDYEGSSDTQLNFHVGSNKDFGMLWIDGDVTGQSRVSLIVDDVSFVTESTNFPELILVENGNDVKEDSFVGEQTVGAFNYVLEYDVLEDLYENHVWGFVNRGLSDAAKKIAETPDEIAKNIKTPPANNLDKQTKELGLWGKQNGSQATIGLNALAMRTMGGDMIVGTSMSQNSSTSNNINVESQITALTASWERKGFYVGGQTRYASFASDVSTDRLSVVQDNEGTGVNASADLGYRFVFPFGGMDFEVAPQVQLTWSRVNFDDFVGPHGEKVSLEDGDLVTGRLGLSWDGEWQGAGGFGQVYGGMNLRGAMDGKTSVNVSGVSVANEQDDLSVDGRLGFSYEWDEGYAVHGEVSALREDDNEIRADLGVQIDF